MSSDEADGKRRTPVAGVPILDVQRSFTGRYSLQPGPDSEPLPPNRDAQNDLFASILREIEIARLPLMKAYKTVMLGNTAILHPEQIEPGAGPEKVDTLLDRIREAESNLARTGGSGSFLLRDLPEFDETGAIDGSGALPSFTWGGIKHLFSRKDPTKVGFGMAVNLDDYLAVDVDEYGEVTYSAHKSFGVKPFFRMPLAGVEAAARSTEDSLSDGGGYGCYLPLFVRLYSEFVAFALQDHPAVLGAHFLSKRFPMDAQRMLDENNAMVSRITSAVLHFLGYASRQGDGADRLGRREKDMAVLRSCGIRLFDSLIDWRSHCCRTLTQEDFARTYARMRIDKVNDLVVYTSNRLTVPPPR